MINRLQSSTDRPDQPYAGIGAGPGDWELRLSLVVQTMREMSLQTDPQAMVRSYIKRMSSLLPSDRIARIQNMLLLFRVRAMRYDGQGFSQV